MHNIETLNKFLKDELAAMETYQQALDKLKGGAGLAGSKSLSPIYEAHKDAVSSLQALIYRLGGTPCEDSGAWGTWVKIVQGGANILSKGVALKALQTGEKMGATDYEEALQNTALSSDVRSLIGWKLLLTQQAHVRTLDRLLGAQSA
jgi:hypothetical protein